MFVTVPLIVFKWVLPFKLASNFSHELVQGWASLAQLIIGVRPRGWVNTFSEQHKRADFVRLLTDQTITASGLLTNILKTVA